MDRKIKHTLLTDLLNLIGIEYNTKKNLEKIKKKEKERLFICPCSKSYFSYAALFTHIKQKHDGKVLIYPYSHQEPSSNPSPKTKGEDLANTFLPSRPLPLILRPLVNKMS